MNTPTIILAIIFLILFIMHIKVFMFQRTVRKVHMKTGIDQKALVVMYPPFYLSMHTISTVRWVAIGALFFFNWIVAIVCLVANFLIPAILPEQDDYKNIKKARQVIFRKMFRQGEDIKYLAEVDSVLKVLIDEIDSKEQHIENDNWKHMYDVGYCFTLHMEDGDDSIGTIIALDYKQRLYKVEFDIEVSLIPVEEPAGGWIDNEFPRHILMMSQQQINDVMSNKLEGTSCHYHF